MAQKSQNDSLHLYKGCPWHEPIKSKRIKKLPTKIKSKLLVFQWELITGKVLGLMRKGIQGKVKDLLEILLLNLRLNQIVILEGKALIYILKSL